jgi:hypothetical protein
VKTVARLVWTFFAATPLTLWFAAIGCVALPVGIAGYLVVPAWTLGTGTRPEPLWLQAVVEVLPFAGLLSLLAASARLPGIVERFALGRGIWLLPAGRTRLLLATLLTALLLALLTATTATTAFLHFALEVSYGWIFWRTFLMAFVDFGLIYLAIWLFGKTSGVWRLVGAFWILLSLTIPLRYISGIPPFSPLEGIGLAVWALFALTLLMGGRLRHAFAPWRERLGVARNRLFPAATYRTGSEIDLLLGTARPWIVAFGQIVPVAAMLLLLPPLSPWMVVAFVFLILMSAIAGAITSTAAQRSRRLWLRCDLDRDQLRRKVELAFWRYNAWCVAVLLAAYVAIGAWLRLPLTVVTTGAGLIVASAVASTCLGLTITRGVRWLESAFCIVMVTVLVRATFMTVLAEFRTAILYEILLVGFAVGFHLLAQARWRRLDWMLCRPA